MGKQPLISSVESPRRTAKKSLLRTAIATPQSLPWTVVCVFALALAIRAAVGLHPYSGERDPPMHGDFEAQRHWMELTIHLPAHEWYTNTTDNDLSYWGLDYPPLSAYVSYIFGKFVQLVDQEAVRLHSSRGYETPRSRAAMRITVLFADLVLFFPALFLLSNFIYVNLAKKRDTRATTPDHCTFTTIAFCLSAPAFILIDHAHFQYNNISLGLFALSVFSFLRWKEALGACLFCCSIFFKQMSLYYAPALFFYLVAQVVRLLRIGHIFGTIRWTAKIFVSIAITSLITFAPWLSTQKTILDVFHRLFPVSRGLYEDKVANVWCSISVLLKLQRLLPSEALFKFCAVATLAAAVPFCIAVFLKPSAVRLLLASSGCSLAAFLFSFQVHEKQILIPLLPMAILFYVHPLHASWFSMSAVFSLFPLLWREGSTTAYVATILIHFVTIVSLYPDEKFSTDFKRWRVPGLLAILMGAALNVLLAFAIAPARAPDIFTLMNTMYACLHFCLIYLNLLQLSFES